MKQRRALSRPFGFARPSLDRRVRIVEALYFQRTRRSTCVRITVLSLCGNPVRLGIQAPRSLAVDREEIYARKHAEESSAAAPGCARPR